MKIIVDKEGAQALGGLLDLALRQGAMTNLDAVNKVRASIQAVEPPVYQPPETEEDRQSSDAEFRG
jgi:hypothetical protein